MKKRYCILIIIIILCISLSFILLRIVSKSNIDKLIIKEVIKPYGETVTINDFLKEDIKNVRCEQDLENIKEIGNYEIKIIVDNNEYISKLIIYDNVIDKIELKEVTMYIDEEFPSIKDFIVNDIDLSLYKYDDLSLKKELGAQEVLIKLYDDHNNKFEGNTKLIIMEDTEPPVFSGLTNIRVEAGNKYNLYSNVKAVDKRFGEVNFTVDDSNVNYDVPGSYKIKYYAKDKVGNKTTKYRNITVTQKDITYKIENFPTYYQYPDYPNGCESSALYNLLRFYKINVSMSQIVNTLKKGDGPHYENGVYCGGNPEVEFVGDPADEHGYGVYQKPIIEVANKFKSGMVDYTGHSLDEVLEIVKKGIPVQIWASVNMQNTNICTNWIYKPTGEKINWICKLHSVVVIGFNKNKVFVSDSCTGKIESYNRKQVEKIYNLYGKRAIYYPN